MLFFVATTIGNLDDISKRAIDTLSQADLILCEDTRHSKVLLDRYGIHRPLLSYHKFNEKKRLEELLSWLREGKNIALITDAGTPCISDPGSTLAKACIEEELPFTAIPGACSAIQALLLSGFSGERFQFIGFLPKKGKKEIRALLTYPGVSILFESPKRILALLQAIAEIDPMRKVALLREMTKKFEECIHGTSQDLVLRFKKEVSKGEFVVCIGPGELLEKELSIQECIHMLQTLHGLTLKEAIKESAILLGRSKKEIYRKNLEER